jgi:RHS repeat-associated protein
VASYAYDYLGRRSSRTIYGAPNIVIKYAYDGDRIIAEYDGSGTLLRKFIYGPGIDEPICLVEVAESNAAYYYHFDGLGSVVALSDVNSVLVERYTYDVFGRPAIRDANGTEIAESAFANPYLFTGRAYDAETGLYYYRARYYDYATGRFLQPDPVAPFLQIAASKYAKREEATSGTYLSADSLEEFLGSDPIGRFLGSDADGRFLQATRFGMPLELNLYTYCGNNAITFIDPYGLGFWRNVWDSKPYIGAILVAGGLALRSPPLIAIGGILICIDIWESLKYKPKETVKPIEKKMEEVRKQAEDLDVGDGEDVYPDRSNNQEKACKKKP